MKEADLPVHRGKCAGRDGGALTGADTSDAGDGAVKYMLDNGMEPTIGNLYKAEYSGSAAYQANPEAAVDMTMFSDQIDAIIARAGLSVGVHQKRRASGCWTIACRLMRRILLTIWS